MNGHRYSGWPGAWCLDCGQPDPGEVCLSDEPHEGSDMFGEPWTECPKHPIMPCPEPLSHRYDPYWKPDADPPRS